VLLGGATAPPDYLHWTEKSTQYEKRIDERPVDNSSFQKTALSRPVYAPVNWTVRVNDGEPDHIARVLHDRDNR